MIAEPARTTGRTKTLIRGGSRTDATSKMERFVIIVNGLKPVTITTKRSILDVAAALDPPLLIDHILTNSAEKIIQSGVIEVRLSDHGLIYWSGKTSLLKLNKHW